MKIQGVFEAIIGMATSYGRATRMINDGSPQRGPVTFSATDFPGVAQNLATWWEEKYDVDPTPEEAFEFFLELYPLAPPMEEEIIEEEPDLLAPLDLGPGQEETQQTCARCGLPIPQETAEEIYADGRFRGRRSFAPQRERWSCRSGPTGRESRISIRSSPRRRPSHGSLNSATPTVWQLQSTSWA